MNIKHTHAKRLYESAKAHIGQARADALLAQLPLSASPAIEKKQQWACDMCALLENGCTQEETLRIRMDCRCKPSPAHVKKLKALYDGCGSVEAFAIKASDPAAASFYCENGALYMTYPRCYCAFVKNSPLPVPRAWCLCTLGYARELFEQIFGCPVTVELLQSVKTGGDKCVMRITKAEGGMSCDGA